MQNESCSENRSSNSGRLASIFKQCSHWNVCILCWVNSQHLVQTNRKRLIVDLRSRREDRVEWFRPMPGAKRDRPWSSKQQNIRRKEKLRIFLQTQDNGNQRCAMVSSCKVYFTEKCSLQLRFCIDFKQAISFSTWTGRTYSRQRARGFSLHLFPW